MSAPDVLVVGAGVSGLTTGVCLAEAGLAVTIVADRFPPDTTSAVAGAIWGLHSTEPGERAARWGALTLAELRTLVGDPATGIRVGDGVLAMRGAPADLDPAAEAQAFPVPADLAGQDGVTFCDPGSLPAGFAAGWRYSAPLAHMPTYLNYLRARFERAGGRLERGTVTALAEQAARRGARAVVNCSGARARDLAADAAVTAIRGQIVVAENPGIGEFFIGLPGASSELVYLFPHGEVIVLGGTEHEDDWRLDPDPVIARRILRDCAAAEPRLAGARVLAHRAGLRPYRPTVRLEAEPRADGPLVVHNYGHGGAGVTLSWGCAKDAADLVIEHIG